jgi:hypothetical protein
VIASQLPDKQMQPILMRHLKTEEPHIFGLYLENFDRVLLKNLNQLLEDTALKLIEMIDTSAGDYAWLNDPNSNMLPRSCRMNLILGKIYEVAEQSPERAWPNCSATVQRNDH